MRRDADVLEVWIFEWANGRLARELVFQSGECRSGVLTMSDVLMLNRVGPGKVHFSSPDVHRRYVEEFSRIYPVQ